ncbi:hypothetical protein OTU49_006915, partial [Cherax quadricarinatus]
MMLTNMSEEERRGGRESFASLFQSSDDTQSNHVSVSADSANGQEKHLDAPNELGNTSVDSDTSEYQELQENVSYSPPNFVASSWEMNYHEAAIFLEEGENNDKFNSHPRDRNALPAYLVTHKPLVLFSGPLCCSAPHVARNYRASSGLR